MFDYKAIEELLEDLPGDADAIKDADASTLLKHLIVATIHNNYLMATLLVELRNAKETKH